jgi:hypothetical protein
MNIKEYFSGLSAKNYKAYLLFLILTLVLWFVIQMTKTYTLNSQIQIEIENIPNHIIVDSLNQKLNVSIEANGLTLWQYNLSNQVYSIPYKTIEKDSSFLSIISSKFTESIVEKYSFDPENISTDKEILYYPYSKKNTKLVPVIANIDLAYSAGYNTLDTLKIIPDSVRLSGTETELKKVIFIKTKKVDLKNISDTVDFKAELLKPTQDVDLPLTEVSIYLPVEKYSENALMVDINVINVPDSLDLSIFPDKAKVSFLVALKRFDKVSKLDFKVVGDYNKRYADKGIIIPKLEGFPSYIINPKLHTKKLDYLIKQKL